MRYGWHGAYLRVDLSTGHAERVEIPDRALEGFIGGVGLGSWICLREGGADLEPLSPEAPLVFALSPLVGTSLTTSAKFAIVARSPLTGYLNDAVSSSHFAIAAKLAGYDAYVVVGRAPTLSRLSIDDGSVTIDPVPGLRGRGADECQLTGYQTAAIGPAGEHLVRYATISHGNRHAGRGGLGAVMGAKRLKAFSVRGTQRLPVADPDGVVAESRRLSEASLGPATAKYRELGTVANMLTFNRLNALPNHNFRSRSFDGAGALSAESFHAANYAGRESCAACSIGCEHLFRTPGGPPVRLEYETLFALGAGVGVSDREHVLEAARLCDALGLDTISTGGTLACFMELGRMPFGDGDGVLRMLPQIAARTGEGDLLAEGSRRLATEAGRPELAMQVKGLEMPGYDPRRLPAIGLGLAVGTRGADHNRSSAYELDFSAEEFSAAKVAAIEDRSAAMDSLILCKFLRGVFTDFGTEGGRLLELVTGKSIDILEAGRRICSLRKVFNIRAGWQLDDDALPDRLLSDALSRERLADMIQAYFSARGWTQDGLVPAAMVDQLLAGR